jgi:DNA mismatch repair protein MutS
LGSAGAVLGYVTDSLCSRPQNLFKLTELKLGASVLIDTASAKNLELFTGTNGSKETSLLESLDRTCTAGGARLLALWLAEPSTDLAVIQQRQKAIAGFVKHPGASARVAELLSNTRDIPRILARLQNRLRNPRELGGIRDSLKAFPTLKEELACLAESTGSVLRRQN